MSIRWTTFLDFQRSDYMNKLTIKHCPFSEFRFFCKNFTDDVFIKIPFALVIIPLMRLKGASTTRIISPNIVII